MTEADTRILLIEDDPGDAGLVSAYLEQVEGPHSRITHVAQLADAFAHLASVRFDVALLDLRLPDADGPDAVRALRAQAADLPIVVLTGLDDEALALQCLATGAQGFLTKAELRPRPLARALSHAMARAAAATERQRAQALDAHLAALVAVSRDAIFSVDTAGNVLTWNGSAERIFGWRADEAIGRPITALVRSPDAATRAVQLQRAVEALQGRDTVEPEEFVRVRRDGSLMQLEYTSCALRDASGRVTHVAVTVRDVTQARQQANALRDGHLQLQRHDQQMRRLAERLIAVREQERTAISRQVHDELGQMLTGVKLDLRWLERRMADGSAAPTLQQRLAETGQQVERLVAAVQNIATGLRPGTLDALGLVAAVRDECRRFEARSGVAASVLIDGPMRPPDDVATVFFRILQELMSNVARHADARELTVALREEPAYWQMQVHDDGVGIAADAAARPGSLGLLGMTERALSIGGSFDIAPGPQGGTLAILRVPRSGA